MSRAQSRARSVREAELLPVLVVLADDDDAALREHTLATLVLLTEDHAANVAECRRTDLGLRKALEAAQRRHATLAQAGPTDEDADEWASVTQLWQTCFA